MRNDEGCSIRDIRKELVRIIIERVQGERMKAPNLLKVEGEADQAETKREDLFEVEDMLNNPYMNRGEVPLAMDIFKPVVPEETELPVIVMIHGGGLVIGDRTSSRNFGRALAKRGYLVFSVEYRLAPRANAFQQLDDVCAGMDLVGERLLEFNVDFTRVFLTAESAGAYLAIYVAAMIRSKALQKAIGYEPTQMYFKALGLMSGMFYTTRDDVIGCLLADQFYGDKATDSEFLKYLDPENPEILLNLPPAFLITSRGDFLNQYSIMYHKALKKAGRKSHLIYYGEKELIHSFPNIIPDHEKSIDAIDKMLAYFEEQAKEGLEYV